MNVHVLTRLDTNPITDDINEVRLFGILKNEKDRMPYFLEYYRNLGIDRFFFTDNNSTDGTREFLLAQPDCHVFFTDNSYSEATSGIFWTKAMLDMHGAGHWCLIADADELFVYPGCEAIKIHELCAFLDSEGSETIFTFMLDMYPSGSLKDAVCIPGKPFQEICSLFDRDYRFVDRISLKGQKLFPRQEVIGGPRTRCFYDDQGHESYMRRLLMHVVERGIVWLRCKGIPFPYIRLKATPLFKVPLVKWRKGYAYSASTHQMNPVNITTMSGVLLHFKFFADFHDRAVKAVQSGSHAQGSIEYKRYLERMDGIGNLIYEGSMTYRSSYDILLAGLMKSNPAYDRLMQEHGL